MRGFYCEVHKNCKTKDGVRFNSTEHHDIIVMIASPRQTQLRLTPTRTDFSISSMQCTASRRSVPNGCDDDRGSGACADHRALSE